MDDTKIDEHWVYNVNCNDYTVSDLKIELCAIYSNDSDQYIGIGDASGGLSIYTTNLKVKIKK